MRKLETENILVIGCAHLGLDDEVLAVLDNVAQHTECTAVAHLGKLATDDEIKMFRSRQKMLRTWEKELEEVRSEIKALVADSEGVKDKGRLAELEKIAASLIRAETGAQHRREKAMKEMDRLIDAQEHRMCKLSSYFGDRLKYVLNDEHTLFEIADSAVIGNAGDFLLLDPVSPHGERINHLPLTHVPCNRLRRFGKSVIQPHPVPQRITHAGRNGIPHCFHTTGTLTKTREVSRTCEQHRCWEQPGAWIVSIAPDGKYAATRLVFRKLKGGKLAVSFGEWVYTAKERFRADHAAIITTDEHAEEISTTTLRTMEVVCFVYETALRFSCGDVGTFPSISHHLSRKLRKREKLRLLDSYSAVGLFCVKTRLVQDDICYSNHQKWLSDYLDEHPEIEGIVNTVGLDENTQLVFGDMTLRHGHQETLLVASQIWEQVCSGHYHTLAEFGRAYSLPSLVDPGDYLEGRICPKIKGFGFATVTDGKTFLQPVLLWGTQFCLGGQWYDTGDSQ